MSDLEARIQELRKRVESAPGSRFFVPLAEEYRKAGRLPEAIGALEEGLIAHPGYVAARVALARAYLEVGKVDESMTAFSKALAEDPSNLVAAKALGDLHLSRGEPIEALKRYLRYRGISGDRRLDAVIARLQEETAPAVERSPEAASPPPPPAFPLTPIDLLSPVDVPTALAEPFVPPGYAPIGRAARETDPHEISGVPYERPSIPPAAPASAQQAPAVPSRDLPLDSIASPRKDDEIVTRKIRLPEANWPFETPTPPPPAAEKPDAAAAENLPSPRSEGRTLADLYLEQGHSSEARDLYEALLAAAPGDQELRRLRDEASRRADLAPPPALPPADPARERRLAKIRILNEWLSVLETRSGTGHR